MEGSTAAPGYTLFATCSITRYISVSRRDAGDGGRDGGIGTTFTAGSLITLVMSAYSLGTSSPGTARMSSVASASEGITFGPTPALNMVGTIDVRSIE